MSYGDVLWSILVGWLFDSRAHTTKPSINRHAQSDDEEEEEGAPAEKAAQEQEASEETQVSYW